MKAAIVVLSDPGSESEEALGRLFNALSAAGGRPTRLEKGIFLSII